MAADVRIRWHLEMVGDVASPLLRQDRQIRTSLRQTEQAQKKLTRETELSGRARQRSSVTATAALGRESRAARQTAGSVRELNRAQAQALTHGSRLAGTASRIAGAYRAQASAARQVAAAERARNAAARAGRGLAGQAQTTGAGMTRATQLAMTAAAGGGIVAKTIGTFAGFEQQMDRVQAVSDGTRSQMAALTQQAQKLGAETSFSAREAADGMYQLSTAGFRTNEVMRAIPGTLDLAAASGTDLASAAELQASALRGFGLRAGDAGRVADALAVTVNRSAVEMYDLQDSLKYVAPVAKATGQSMEGMLAAIGLMGNVGVKGSQAGTTLRTAMVRLTDPTEKSRNALEGLGIKASELRGPKGLLPLPEILQKITDGAQGVDKGTRNAALAAIFGREALSGMVAMVEAGPDALERNIKALEASEGTAKRTAQTMRDNVAGAWDEFTGSLETAAITLTQRFGPALKDSLRGGADTVNELASVLSGSTKVQGDTALVRSNSGLLTPRDATTAEQYGEALRQAAKDAKAVADAIRPVVRGAADLAAEHPNIVRVASAILGISLAAKAIRFAGAISGVTAFGRTAVRVLGPVGRRLGSTLIDNMSPAMRARSGAVTGTLRRLFGRAGTSAGAAAATNAGTALAGDGIARTSRGGLRTTGRSLGRTLGSGLATSAVASAGTGIAAPGAITGKVPKGRMSSIGRNLGRTVGRGIVGGMIAGLALAAPDLLKAVDDLLMDALGGNRNSDSKSQPSDNFGPASPFDTAKNFVEGLFGGNRRGGIIGYRNGGLIPAAVSPGELLIRPDGATALVPGARQAADSVLTALPAGTAVLTDDGQSRLAAGASLASAIADQAPHFRAGGIVPGRYESTAYGPPWGGIQGTGVTRTGVNLKDAPRIYGVAVDPNVIRLGSKVYAHPNPFGYSGAFRAFDTGGAIKGRRLDFYDWRGRESQNAWGRRSVRVSAGPLNGGGPTSGGGEEGSGSDRTASVPIMLGRSRTRSGLLSDALGQGIAAGEAGLTRGEILGAVRGRRGARRNPLMESIAQAQSATRRQVTVQGAGEPSSGDPTSSSGPLTGRWIGGGWKGTENVVMRAIRGLGSATYKRSTAINGNQNSDHNTWIRNAFAADIGIGTDTRRGDRIFQAIARRIGVPARKGSWNVFRNKPVRGVRSQLLWHAPDGSHRDHVHYGARRMRRGGVLGYRGGGYHAETPGAGTALTQAVNRVTTFAAGTFDRLDRVIGQAAEARLEALRSSLLARVRRGGDKRVVQRLQGAIDLIDGELGRRIGRLRDAIATRTSTLEGTRTSWDRGGRRLGIDPSSSAGLERSAILEQGIARPILEANVRSAASVLRRARRTGDVETIRQAVTDLDTARSELEENLTTAVERWREWLRTSAQEAADRAGHALELVQGGLGQLDVAQRLTGLATGSGALGGAIGGTLGFLGLGGAAAADTPEGMRQRATSTITGLVPALQGQRGALEGQLAAARATGDVAGVRAATLALQSNATELATAVADAAQLMRDAAVRAAEDTLAGAAHGSNLASSGLQRLELEQRLAGTHEAGGATRAAFITGTIVPALTAELGAIQEQQRIYREQGMAAELRQAIESEAAKRNEILQAQLDAQEQIADNTDPRQFGGTLGFGFGGEVLTDSLVTIGNGV